jgi:hypothetical protein
MTEDKSEPSQGLADHVFVPSRPCVSRQEQLRELDTAQ